MIEIDIQLYDLRFHDKEMWAFECGKYYLYYS